jgi:hypothetical protein
MAEQGPQSRAPRQRLERLPPMAGFQVSTYGPVLGVHRGQVLPTYTHPHVLVIDEASNLSYGPEAAIILF